MAKHTIYGVGPTIFFSNSPGSQHRPLYLVPTEFGLLNNDGTHTYFTGTGFTYDWVLGTFTGGTVTTIRHYDINGLPLDEITGLSVPTTSLEAVFFSLVEYYTDTNPAAPNLFSGDDVIDARVRAGNAIVDDFLFGSDGNDRIYGGSGVDSLIGGNGNDQLYGGLDSDVLDGGRGNDALYGEGGDDILFGGEGSDRLDGGVGNDRLEGEDGIDVLLGGTGFDDIQGGSGNDVIRAGADEDIADGGTGADTIYGDDGSDRLRGSEGNDRIWGGNGDDTILGDDGADALYGDANNDSLDGGLGNDVLSGGSGNDRLDGATGNDRLDGGVGNDLLIGDSYDFSTSSAGRDLLVGGDGDDTMWGRANSDSLNGGAGLDTSVYTLSNFADLTITKTSTGFVVSSLFEGRDTLIGVEQIATRDGTYGWNASSLSWGKVSNLTAETYLPYVELATIDRGTADDDVRVWTNAEGGPFGSFGSRVYLALDGNDSITFATDTLNPLNSSVGDIAVFGGNGNDSIIFSESEQLPFNVSGFDARFFFDGGASNDRLVGGYANDTLVGGSGDDVLNGSVGNDTLSGGTGVDTFEFTRFTRSGIVEYSGWGNDVVTDFVVGTDRLRANHVVTSNVVDTAAGLLITATQYSTPQAEINNDPLAPNALITSTILLEGLHGAYSIGELFA